MKIFFPSNSNTGKRGFGGGGGGNPFTPDLTHPAIGSVLLLADSRLLFGSVNSWIENDSSFAGGTTIHLYAHDGLHGNNRNSEIIIEPSHVELKADFVSPTGVGDYSSQLLMTEDFNFVGNDIHFNFESTNKKFNFTIMQAPTNCVLEIIQADKVYSDPVLASGLDVSLYAYDNLVFQAFSWFSFLKRMKITDKGTNDVKPDDHAILDLSSTTKGFLPPRMTSTQKNAIASPATGLIVFDTDLNKLQFYTGASWEGFSSEYYGLCQNFNHLNYTAMIAGTFSYASSGGNYLGGYFSLANLNDGAKWTRYYQKGNYQLEIFAWGWSDQGKQTWKLDGTLVDTIDIYNAGNIQNVKYSSVVFAITTDGSHELSMKTESKNGSSSGYYQRIMAIHLYKVQ